MPPERIREEMLTIYTNFAENSHCIHVTDIAERPPAELDDILMLEMGAGGAPVGHGLSLLGVQHCLSQDGVHPGLVALPLPPALSQASTSASRRAVICSLIGR